MTVDRGRLANIDRRLFAEMHEDADGSRSGFGFHLPPGRLGRRYCHVAGLSMGRAIVALIESELATIVDEDVDSTSAVSAERQRILD